MLCSSSFQRTLASRSRSFFNGDHSFRFYFSAFILLLAYLVPSHFLSLFFSASDSIVYLFIPFCLLVSRVSMLAITAWFCLPVFDAVFKLLVFFIRSRLPQCIWCICKRWTCEQEQELRRHFQFYALESMISENHTLAQIDHKLQQRPNWAWLWLHITQTRMLLNFHRLTISLWFFFWHSLIPHRWHMSETKWNRNYNNYYYWHRSDARLSFLAIRQWFSFHACNAWQFGFCQEFFF